MAEALTEKTLKEAIKIGQQIGEAKNIAGIAYTVIPNDCQIVSLEKYQHSDYANQPHRKKGTVAVLDAKSFIEYWMLFSDEHSRAFADETASKVVGVLDYHGIGENSPRWGQHRVALTLRDSEEWKRWTACNGKKLGQMEFAEFIEDNTPDITTPPAAEMLEVARTLHAKTDVDFSSAIRTSNGSVQLKYSEQVKGTYGSGNVDIPEQFRIFIPIFVGTARVGVTARLRYRLNSGKLTFWYDLLRADVERREAFLKVLEDIQEGVTTKIINGSPAN
jgi:uncharacterized protein YfdQ (DUF2303 family)